MLIAPFTTQYSIQSSRPSILPDLLLHSRKLTPHHSHSATPQNSLIDILPCNHQIARYLNPALSRRSVRLLSLLSNRPQVPPSNHSEVLLSNLPYYLLRSRAVSRFEGLPSNLWIFHLSSRPTSPPSTPPAAPPLPPPTHPVDSPLLHRQLNRRSSISRPPARNLTDTRPDSRRTLPALAPPDSRSHGPPPSPATDPATLLNSPLLRHPSNQSMPFHPQNLARNPARVLPSVQVINPLISP